MAKIDVDAEIKSVRNKVQTSTPSTTGAGYSHSFVKADGMYLVDQNGIVTGPFGQGGLDKGARVYRGSNQTISEDTNTPISFTAERWDTDDIFNSGTNPTRLTCKTAGKYIISGTIKWETQSGAVGLRQVQIKINDPTENVALVTDRRDGVGSAETYHSVSTIYYLEVGDYIELFVYQTGTSESLDILNHDDTSPEFMMQLIEPVAASGGLDIGVRVYSDSIINILENTPKVLDFTHQRWDTDGCWAVGVPSRLVCNTAGKYVITGNVQFDQYTGSIGRRRISIVLNGGYDICKQEMVLATGQLGYPAPVVSTIYDLDVGDYVELEAYANGTGTDIDIFSTAQTTPEFAMQRIG